MRSLKLPTLLLSLFIVDYIGLVNVVKSATVTDGLQWGSMGTYIKTSTRVYHLDEDAYLPGNILFSTVNALMTTDGRSTHLIVGSEVQHYAEGYAEGKAGQARFWHIAGFLQTSSNMVLLADTYNHCLRYVDRITNLTTTFAGRCKSAGYIDGNLGNSRFFHPRNIIRNPMNPALTNVIDSDNNAIRSVDLVHGDVKTLIRHLPSHLFGAAFEAEQEDVYILFDNSLGKLNMETLAFTSLTPTANRGGLDGAFSKASFAEGRGLLCKNNICLVTDHGSNRLRVVDVKKETVYSVCTGSKGAVDGPITACSLSGPHGLLLKSDTLYIGEYDSIRRISVSGFFPCEDVSLQLSAGEEVKCLEVIPGHMICFPPGVSSYSIPAKNCKMKITITRELNGCQNKPCLNSGICRVGENGTYTCDCHDGWTGTDCQTEIKNLTCPQKISAVGDILTMKANVSLWPGDHMALGVGKHIYYKQMTNGSYCTTNVDVLDPRVKWRLDINANYKISCNVLKNFRDLLLTITKSRSNQMHMISRGYCNKSADYPIEMACENDVLNVSWPTDCQIPYKDSDNHIFVVIIKDFLKRHEGSILDLLVPNHLPPIIYPSLNQEGFPASVVLTHVCTGGMKYLNTTDMCQ